MSKPLDWLRHHVPPFDWNLKGDPQGTTARALLGQPEIPFESLEMLIHSLQEHRQWFHLTDEEGRQLDPADIVADREIWVSLRQTPWSS